MTRLERYRLRLEELEAKRNQFMRQGKYMQMQKLDAELTEVRKLIEEAEKYSPKPIRELVSMDKIQQSGLIPALIECHLAADYLNDCCYTVNDIIKGMGFSPASIIPDLKEIISKSNVFASLLCDRSEQLGDLLVRNDTLIAALHKKTLGHISQRLSRDKHKSA